METAPRSIKLSISSDLNNMLLIGLTVNKICEYLAFSELESNQIETCLIEAVTNAIKHAYNNDPNQTIHVKIDILTDRVVFAIHETGKPWEQYKKPKFGFNSKDLNHLPEGGMGLHIIHEIMDEVSYQTIAGMNIHTFSKYRPKNISIDE